MRTLVAMAAVALLSACTTDRGPSSYSAGSVGQVNRTVSGSIVSVRSVAVKGTNNVGGVAGAGVGAVGGSSLGGGTRSNLIGAIGGAVVGGLAGSAIERGQTEYSGFEYVVETSNGNLMTLVQGAPALSVGERVLILYGSPSRLIADPRK